MNNNFSSRPSENKSVSTLILLISIITIILASFILYSKLKIIDAAVYDYAKIVNVRDLSVTNRIGNVIKVDAPIFLYTDQFGETNEFAYYHENPRKVYHIGDYFYFYYFTNENKMDKTIIEDNFFEIFGLAFLLIFTGLIALSITLSIRSKKRKTRTDVEEAPYDSGKDSRIKQENNGIYWEYNKYKALAISFLVLGIVFILFAGAAYIANEYYLDNQARATGTVVENVNSNDTETETYAPIVEWKSPDGNSHSFNSGISSFPPKYKHGDEVTILYDTDDYSDARIETSFERYFAVLFLLILGLILSLISTVFFILLRSQNKKWRYLKSNGIPVQAVITSVEKQESSGLIKMPKWLIHAQWQDSSTGLTHSFQSPEIIYAPSQFIKEGDKISVYIERNNPEKYIMDISFLEQSLRS